MNHGTRSKCAEAGCNRAPLPGSNFCAIHGLDGKGAVYIEAEDPKKDDPQV
jgi:hypothetical protein